MNFAPRKIRVLVVDDSAVVRRLVRDLLSADPEIEVVGTAVDPYVARDMIAQHAPDVLTLDLEMPRMDGLTFLRLLMERRPMPVLVMSSLTPQGSDFALEAIRLGAIDVLAKPGTYSIGDIGPLLVAKIKAAAGARLRHARAFPLPATPLPPPPRAPVPPRAAVPAAAAPSASRRRYDPRSLILLGASTGGIEVLREMLSHLPTDLPPIAIVQHIPEIFSKTFADRMNQLCAIEVREAADGDRLEPGAALIAPGNHHMVLHWRGDHYIVRTVDGPKVWHQRPAVDILFKSAVEAGASPYCLAGVLTGMGKDGAEGLLQLYKHGADTFAQDEATSTVFGMPRAAWENGAAQTLVPLDRLAPFIIQHSLARVSGGAVAAGVPS